jgi:hypothetical protein
MIKSKSPPDTIRGDTPQQDTPTITTPQEQPQQNKNPSSGRHSTSGRGRGKITRNSQANLTHNQTKVVTTNTSTNISSAHTNALEVHEKTINRKPPPINNVQQPNMTSLRQAFNQSLKYSFRIAIRVFPNDKETEHFTQINIVQIVLQAVQAGEPDTKLILPSDTTI